MILLLIGCLGALSAVLAGCTAVLYELLNKERLRAEKAERGHAFWKRQNARTEEMLREAHGGVPRA